jgi:4-hydroxyproline epimerase
LQRVQVIDSHTGGEPTRLVVDGGPDLGTGALSERRDRFARDHDRFRSAVVNEPRGSDVLVGALLCEPVDPVNHFGVIFFNNVGMLGMCGHGTIGLVATLARMGRIEPGVCRIETPVGVVAATLHDDGSVSVRNVVSWRKEASVHVDVAGIGRVTGDVAWGGNWFFLISEHPFSGRIEPGNAEEMTQWCWAVRQEVNRFHPDVDHVELFGPPSDLSNHSRNFVLCPGKAWDRSACGTGTSAKVACLVADGKLRPGQVWRQESTTGSVFEARVEETSQGLVPTIRGTAYVTAESTLILDPNDPLCWGLCS